VRPQKAENRQIRVLIADNHPVFREGLQQLLEAESDFVVVGQADDGAQALRLTIELKPDILNGKSNKDISAQYSLSEQTVKHHFTRIFTKLGISSRLQLILLVNSRRAR